MGISQLEKNLNKRLERAGNQVYLLQSQLVECQRVRNRAIFTLQVIAGWIVDHPLAEEEPRQIAGSWLEVHGFEEPPDNLLFNFTEKENNDDIA
jgi:hypothetical protein